ncbi:MAG: sensor histidine kinase [Spirochaetes bacterium]|nr:sensor histidine kinase [Spirochaetota bacterium]
MKKCDCRVLFSNKIIIIGITIALTIIVGFADIATTSHYRLYFFYVIPIFISAFFLNMSFGFVISFVSALFIIVSSYIDRQLLHAYYLWNAGMMLVIFMSITYLTKLLNSMKNVGKEKSFIEEKNRILVSSLQEKELLIRETNHRMKNNLSMLASLIKLSSGVDSAALIMKLSNRIRTFSVLYERLSYSVENGAKLNLNNYLKEIIDLIIQNFDIEKDTISCAIAGADFLVHAKTASLMGLVINELVTNSIQHAFAGMRDTMKEIFINYSKNDEGLIMTYADNGPGYNYANSRQSEGHIGFLLIESITKQMGGEIRPGSDASAELIFVFSGKNLISGGE